MMQLRRSEKNENSTIIILYTYKKKTYHLLLGKSCLVHMILKRTILKKKNDKYILKKKQFAKVLDGTEVLYVGR